MAVNGMSAATTTLINSIVEKANLENQFSISMAVKAQNLAKQQGANAVQLIKSAQLLDTRA